MAPKLHLLAWEKPGVWKFEILNRRGPIRLVLRSFAGEPVGNPALVGNLKTPKDKEFIQIPLAPVNT